MTIIAYFDEVRSAANAIDQLTQNPEVKDVSFIGQTRIDSQIEEGKPTLTQGDVEVEPVYSDAFYGSLLGKTAQVGQFIVNGIGQVIIGGNLLDLFQVSSNLTDKPILNLASALKEVGLSEYASKIADVVSDGNIVVLLTTPKKDRDDIDRLLENHQTIDTDFYQSNFLNFE